MVEPVTYFCTTAPVTAICFYQPRLQHSKKTLLMAGTGSGTLSSWDLTSCRLEQSVELFSSPILWLDILQENLLIVQARFQQEVKIFNYDQDLKWTELCCVPLGKAHLGFCRGDVQNNFSVFPTSDNFLKIMEWSEKESFTTVSNIEAVHNSGMVTAVRLAVEQPQQPILILSTYESGLLMLSSISDCKSATAVATFHFNIDEFVPLALDFDSSRSICVVAGSQDKIISLKVDLLEKSLTVLTERTLPSKGISSLRLRCSDKKILIGGSWDSTIKLFSWIKPEKLKPLAALKFHSDAVEAVACTRYPVQGIKLKGHLIAAASKDQKISLWSVYNDI